MVDDALRREPRPQFSPLLKKPVPFPGWKLSFYVSPPPHAPTSPFTYLLLTPAFVLLSMFAYSHRANRVGKLVQQRNGAATGQVCWPDNYLFILTIRTFGWWQNNLIYAVIRYRVHCPRALGVVGQPANAHAGLGACRVFHAYHAAHDCGGQPVAVLYTPDLGLLTNLGVLGASPTNGLGQPETALGAVIVVTIWKEAGFFMVFYLAASQTVSPELRDAARPKAQVAGNMAAAFAPCWRPPLCSF